MNFRSDVVGHAYHLGGDTGGLDVQGQPGLHSEALYK